ncbi:DUF3413 domain-containing protein [Steroidobacter denitrificans]|uniref:DUF3413 domain-containing protein n=1 Tax=Steroidobacter denitrificans TaxID=465721 RepID=UPI00082D1226|nr:DUF3413 domain-containing protein [Steroidobacter denitrificans]
MTGSAIVAALLITQRYFAVHDFDFSPGALLFRAAMLLGHFTALTTLLMLPVLLFLLLIPRPRVVIPLGVAVLTSIVLVLLIDTQVYQLYRFHINAGVLNLLFGGAARETFVFPTEMYLIAILIMLVVLAAAAGCGALAWRHVSMRPVQRNLGRAVGATVLVSMLGFHVAHMWADVKSYRPWLEQTEVLPLRYVATAKRALRAIGVASSAPSHEQFIGKTRGSNLSYPLQPLQCAAPRHTPNIVILMIDSWRFDAMDAAVTPNTHAFAQRAVQFTSHYSGGNATRIGVFSFFYSVPGTYWHSALIERRSPVLIDELLERHYDIQVFQSAPLHSPEFDRTVFTRLSNPRMTSDGANPAEWDRDLTDDFLRYLDARSADEPFFAFLFYDSSHSFVVPPDHPQPFQPSAPTINYLKLDNQTDAVPLLNLYRNSVHYVDSLIGEVLDAMKGRGLLDDTIVIITGDHGQEFNDNGRNFWGHNSNFSKYQTSVPFVFYAPNREPAVLGHQTTHFDVAPTLLGEYLGCNESRETYSVGRSLFDTASREPIVFSDYSDFAIASQGRIALVRQHGMSLYDADYKPVEALFDGHAIRAALEQRARFYKASRAARQ